MLYRTAHIVSLLFLIAFGSSCSKPQPTNWKPMYFAESKDPYGFYLFSSSLKQLYPNARVSKVPASISMGELSQKMNDEGPDLFLCLAKNMAFSPKEIESIADWLEKDNDVVLIAERFDEKLLKALNLELERHFVTGTHGMVTGKKDYAVAYHQNEQFLSQYFLPLDKAKDVSKSVSRISGAGPNVLAFTSGRGRLLVSSTPMAFSNFFLLEGENQHYLEDVFSYTVQSPKNIYYIIGELRAPAHSDWSILWNNRATRMALIIALVALLLFVMFQAKRRQRMIPVVAPLRNDAATFVETIGKLYYNKKDNKNLALKMVQHFFELLRNNYHLNTLQLDEDFEIKLSGRSGNDRSEVNYLLTQIKMIQNNSVQIDDAFLFSLYRNMQSYNIKTNS